MCVVGMRSASGWLLVGVLLGLFPASVQAEEGSWSAVSEVGAKAAMGGTSFRASADDALVGVEARATVGYSFGVYATLWRARWLRLQTELLYSSRQSHLRQVPDGMSADYSLRYLELPVLARLDIPTGRRYEPFVALGASPGVLVSAEHGSGRNLDGVLRAWDLGLVAAAGSAVVLSRRWQATFELRYTHGVTDVFARTSRENRGLLFTMALGYRASPRPELTDDRSGDESSVEQGDQAVPAVPPITGEPASELDRWSVMAGMLPCYREHPRAVSWIRSLSADQNVLEWIYVREFDGSHATLRLLDLMIAEGHPVDLAQCLSNALDGMTLPHASLQQRDEGPFRLVLRATALGRLLREAGY